MHLEGADIGNTKCSRSGGKGRLGANAITSCKVAKRGKYPTEKNARMIIRSATIAWKVGDTKG